MNDCKYVGMDVHKTITVIAVVNAVGQNKSSTKIRTQGEPLQAFFRGLGRTVHVAFEEGTQSAWLHQLLKPLVASVTVFDARTIQRRTNGQKSDDGDAENIARLLRTNDLVPIYKGDPAQLQLTKYCRAYENLVEDTTRAKNRLKALYRARGIACPGREIYRAAKQEEYLAKLPDEAARFRATTWLDQLATETQTQRRQRRQRDEIKIRRIAKEQLRHRQMPVGDDRPNQRRHGQKQQHAQYVFRQQILYAAPYNDLNVEDPTFENRVAEGQRHADQRNVGELQQQQKIAVQGRVGAKTGRGHKGGKKEHAWQQAQG